MCCSQAPVSLVNLGVGATFGESILHDLPRDSTVVTKTTCELLRVEQQDFRLIWEVSRCVSIRARVIRVNKSIFQALKKTRKFKNRTQTKTKIYVKYVYNVFHSQINVFTSYEFEIKTITKNTAFITNISNMVFNKALRSVFVSFYL